MADLDQRAAQVPIVEQLERVPADARMWYEHDSASHSHIPVGRMCSEAARLIREQAAEIASKDAEIELLREAEQSYAETMYLQDQDIWRLRARVAELEAQIAAPKQQHYSDSVTIEYRDAGPTPLRGRITRRTT